MPDPFDDIDPGADFEAYGVGLKPITVTQTEPEGLTAVATVEDVPATKLIRRRRNGDQVPEDVVEFVFRANRLGWLPKANDLITDASGQTWIVQSAALEAFDALCRATVVLKR